MTGRRIGAARWINATDVRTDAPPPPPTALPPPAAGAPGSRRPAPLLSASGRLGVDPRDPGDPALALRCPSPPHYVLCLLPPQSCFGPSSCWKASESLTGAEGKPRPVGSGRKGA